WDECWCRLNFTSGKTQPFPRDALIVRHPADRRLLTHRASAGAVHDPLQYAHVFAEAGPHEVSVFILAKPVHMEDTRRFAQRTLHPDPMPEIVAHVITAERQHGHRVTPHI